MKVILLCGGLGTRLREETEIKPKPMVEIGDKPILWHIMKIYSFYGHKEFSVCLGYKGNIIRDFFTSNIVNEDWAVELLETGLKTQTGGRIKRAMKQIGSETVLATYGDGLGNVNIDELVKFHKSHGKLATLTAVRPPSRFGEITFEGDKVVNFKEKPQVGRGWINGGFFVLEPEVSDYIKGDETPFELEPMERLSSDGQLMAFKHDGFWQPMDVIREKEILDKLWKGENAPWKLW